MTPEVLEFEGTVEEIQPRLDALRGSDMRLHVTVAPQGPMIERPAASVIDRIMAMAQSLPEEVKSQLPTDLADQHDHYAYGVPKR